MSRLLMIRLLATLIGVGCYATLVFYPGNGVLPFDTQPAGHHHLAVQPSPPYTMPAGLHAGERIDLRDQDFAARTLLVLEHGPAGARFSIVLPTGRHMRTVTAMLATRTNRSVR